MKNFLPKQYKKTTKLKINHSYLVEQFADYSKIFKEIEKVVKRGDYTLGQQVNEFEKNFAKRTGAKFVRKRYNLMREVKKKLNLHKVTAK